MESSWVLEFSGLFDREAFRVGVPALFTVDPDGDLIFDAARTREAWGRAEGGLCREEGHFLVRDRATGWVQYVLATAPALLTDHPRADVVRFEAQAGALAALASFGRPPTSDGSGAWALLSVQAV